MKVRVSIKQSIAAFLALLALYLFSLAGVRPERSPSQRQFDEWLTVRERQLGNLASHMATDKPSPQPSASAKLPALSFRMYTPDTGDLRQFELGPSADPMQSTRILRLLQLMRESDIFSLGQRDKGQADIAVVAITVQDGEQKFFTRFQESDIRSNTKALLLLKLALEYSELAQPATPDKA